MGKGCEMMLIIFPPTKKKNVTAVLATAPEKSKKVEKRAWESM